MCLNEMQDKRLTRIETRLTAFTRWAGFSPGKDWEDDARLTVSVVNGALRVSGPEVSLGALSFVANENHLRGPVSVYVGSNYWGEINV